MKKTIIAIEDDPQIAELLKLVLASDELEIIHYDNGDHGLVGVVYHVPDLIILDLMIPGMTGAQVYASIRAHEKVKHIPIIICSVQQQSFDERINFARSEIDFYVSKPFDLMEFRDKINRVLNVKQWVVPNERPKPKPTGPLRPINDKLLGANPQDSPKVDPKPDKPAQDSSSTTGS